MESELGMLKKILEFTFTGTVADDELRRLYSGAACLIFPSLYEGSGYTALEAMACGWIAIYSDTEVLREVCSEIALYVPPISAFNFAQALQALFEDDSLRIRLRDAGTYHVGLFVKESLADFIRGRFFGAWR